MSASLGKQMLTFSKLKSLHKITNGISVRAYRGLKNYNQDLRPEHVEKRKADLEQPGSWKNYTDLRFWTRYRGSNKDKYDPEMVTKMLSQMDLKLETENDMPVENMTDPFVEAPRKCLLCEYDIAVDYKNIQLLSQFVSPYTGRIYGRRITGLCVHMQRVVSTEIYKARMLGFMPKIYKDPKYQNDPRLYNPFKRVRQRRD